MFSFLMYFLKQGLEVKDCTMLKTTKIKRGYAALHKIGLLGTKCCHLHSSVGVSVVRPSLKILRLDNHKICSLSGHQGTIEHVLCLLQGCFLGPVSNP